MLVCLFRFIYNVQRECRLLSRKAMKHFHLALASIHSIKLINALNRECNLRSDTAKLHFIAYLFNYSSNL